MRLARSGPPGGELPIVAGADGRWHDLRPVTADIDPSFLGRDGLSWARDALDEGELPLAEEPGRFGPPLAPAGKIVCVGLNYSDHAAETGADAPAEPILFMKAPDTVVGPDDDVLIPRRSVKTDYEVELAVVIGRIAAYLDRPEQAAGVIAGYAISNDVSERTFQIERGGQWDKGKNCATFNPLGPWLVTADAVPDAQSLGLRLSVNGALRQDSSTSKMIFDVPYLVWYISQFMTLYPGDVINTGTPAGVALGDPDRRPYLKAGDVVELEIDGLGRQRQTMRDA
jgi:2-keto-4-pentenoate hydratase/2-oxohepta-3-ene-1,7-dioic acid hydratase in catechol pathway